MTIALLDVNVLLALFDADHVDHDRAHEWLTAESGGGWATCPITENGFVRIISQPRYPSSIPTAEAAGLMAEACAAPEHSFWSCDVSLLDGGLVSPDRLLGSAHVTDTYLLALAVRRSGRFATFDRGVRTSPVPEAESHHLVVL